MATVTDPQLVTPTETSLLYMARRRSLRLIRIPRGNFFNQTTGQKEVGVVPGQAVQFQDGVLRVPKDGEVILEDGKAADALEIAAWLDSHRLLGDVEEGFWRVDPTAPPVSEEEMSALTNAAIDLDDQTLERVLEQERAGWNREQVVSVAERALGRVREVRAAAEAHAAEQEKKQGKPPEQEGGS